MDQTSKSLENVVSLDDAREKAPEPNRAQRRLQRKLEREEKRREKVDSSDLMDALKQSARLLHEISVAQQKPVLVPMINDDRRPCGLLIATGDNQVADFLMHALEVALVQLGEFGVFPPQPRMEEQLAEVYRDVQEQRRQQQTGLVAPPAARLVDQHGRPM